MYVIEISVQVGQQIKKNDHHEIDQNNLAVSIHLRSAPEGEFTKLILLVKTATVTSTVDAHAHVQCMRVV